MEHSNNQIAEKIKLLRKSKNLSQERFGRKIGLSGKSISAYERGRSIPPIKILNRIASTFNTVFLQIQTEKKVELEDKINRVRDALTEIESILKEKYSV